jgi:hypothetical protein
MSVGIYPVPFSGIQESKLTTTGDIIYASAANTPARLGMTAEEAKLLLS